MVMSKAKTVDQYIGRCDPEIRPAIEAFRKLVRRGAPKAEESMAYGMPTYMQGGPLAAFGAQKNHLSFYLCDTDIVAAHRKALGKLDCGKSCLRGKRLQDFPLRVLSAMVRQSASRRKTPPKNGSPTASNGHAPAVRNPSAARGRKA